MTALQETLPSSVKARDCLTNFPERDLARGP